MRRLLLLSAALSLSIVATIALFFSQGPASAQTWDFGSPKQTFQAYHYKNITTQTTTVVKSGSGIMHALCYNTPGANATVTIYDNTSAAAPAIATITLSTADAPQCLLHDIYFTTGLTIVTGVANSDITVSYY